MSNKNKLVLGGVIALALLLGGLSVAKAGSAWDWNDFTLKSLVADRLADKVPAPEAVSVPRLGAVSGPDLPNPHCENDECTWVVKQTWIHGTTTIFSIQDPFEQATTTGGVAFRSAGWVGITGASTTVDLVRIYQTGNATTSFGLACGPSTGAVGKGQIEVAKYIVTTTGFVATNTLGIIENNVTAAQGARINGGTVQKVMMGPQDPYFVCLADENPDGALGIQNADSTSTGYIVVRFKRTRF